MINISDFKLDEIVSIELIGEEETLDITVADTHMFFANDIYTHNSSLQEDVIEADKIAESYNKIMTADFVMSLSRKANDKMANTARVHIIKNRFGSDGKTFPATVNIEKGIFDVYDENSSSGVLARKAMSNGNDLVKRVLHKRLSALTD